MEPFALVKDKMEVFVHLRIEKHGEENVNGYDVKVTGNFANSVLLKLHPELRDTFYTAAAQADVEDFKKELRFPRIKIKKGMPWDMEVPRTLLRLHDIDSPDNDLVLSDGTAHKFFFDCLEGGTVKLSFTIKLAKMTEEEQTKLLRANGQTLPISIESAALEEKPDNFEQAEQLSKEPMSEARQNAESQFVKPAGAASPDAVVDAPLTKEEKKRSGRKAGNSAPAAE